MSFSISAPPTRNLRDVFGENDPARRRAAIWVEGRSGEAPGLAGTDFIIVRDGRIAAIYSFFDKLP